MSSHDYRKAIELLEQNSDLGDFVGNSPEEWVRKAEEKLGHIFPSMYKNFLLDYGAGNFGSEEFFGIIKDDFDNSGVPDAVWFTLKQRKEVNLPSHLVIIYHTGGEEMFCLDLGKRDAMNEAPVVNFIIGVEPENQYYELIASDFGEFLLQRIRLELGIS